MHRISQCSSINNPTNKSFRTSLLPNQLQPGTGYNLYLPVLGLDKVGEGLGLLEAVVVVIVVVVVGVLGADVVHLVDVAALGAALDGALAGHLFLVWRLVVWSQGGKRGSKKKLTVSQMTLWESAGKPVQPAYCSSPAERTGMGFSMVPMIVVLASLKLLLFPSLDGLAYPCGRHQGASCRKRRRPPSCRESRDARDRWPAQHRWGQCRQRHRGRRGPPWS